MVKSSCKYFYILLLLVIVTLIVANCGGGSDTGAVPGVPQQQTEQFITKDVSGYIYYSPSPEDSEIDKKFVILNAPLAGEDSLLNQLSSYYQEANPDFWNSSEMQSLYGTMSSEMGKWIPLPAYSPDARLYGIYQDSKSSSPIPVNSDGYFETTVQVKTTDTNISFEVVTGDSACYPVEGVSSSDITTSEEDTTELISCPEQVITLPGWFVIFAVRGEAAVNLKDAGLTFTLNDPSVGWVTEPFYLKCMGAWNYNIAYGIFLAKPGLSTPVSTTITAQTSSGISLNIFTEVVKSCASLSGHVGGAGVIPEFGFVYSLGFDAFSCLDESGNYKLNKVFRGHFRNVTAVYWIQENGVLTKHREERVINFFDGDMVNFDLPEGIQPTPTIRPAEDPFYFNQLATVTHFFGVWREEFGAESARQKIVEWINGNVPSSLPVPEGIVKAYISEDEDTKIMIEFEDGMVIGIMTELLEISERPTENEQSFLNEESNGYRKIQTNSIESSAATTFKPEKILILAPFAFESWYGSWWGHKTVFEDTVYELNNNYNGYYKPMLKSVVTTSDTFLIDLNDNYTNQDLQTYLGINAQPALPVLKCKLNPGGNLYNIVTPWDFGSLYSSAQITLPGDYSPMTDYGMIYIDTHGDSAGVTACPFISDYNKILSWANAHSNFRFDHQNRCIWEYDIQLIDFSKMLSPYNYPDDVNLVQAFIPVIKLRGHFFRYLVSLSQLDFSGSVIYMNACKSADIYTAFPTASIYLGNAGGNVHTAWSQPFAYTVFRYMLKGITKSAHGEYDFPYWLPDFDEALFTSTNLKVNKPLHVTETVTALEVNFKVNPDPKQSHYNDLTPRYLLYFPPTNPPEIYFPGDVNITVEEE